MKERMRIIIVEGVDRVGKSTLVREIIKRSNGEVIQFLDCMVEPEMTERIMVEKFSSMLSLFESLKDQHFYHC